MENFLQKILQIRIKKIIKKIKKTEKQLKKSDQESIIHNFRIAIRRLRSVLEVFEKQIPIKRRYLKTLKKVFKISGNIRDYDVIQKKIETVTKDFTNFPMDTKLYQEIESLKQNLTYKRKKFYKDFLEFITSKEYKVLKKNFFNHLENIELKNFNISSSKEFSIQFLCLSKFYQLLSDKCWYENNYDILQIHHFRKEIKKTRYFLELFNEFYKTNLDFKIFIQELKELQDLIGLLIDLYMIQKELKENSNSFIENFLKLLQQEEMSVWKHYLDKKEQFFNQRKIFIHSLHKEEL